MKPTPPERTVSPRELAEALGVSESSVKRWVDKGRIRAHRTEGGHRRIEIREAVRFARQRGRGVARPELLSLEMTIPEMPDAEDPAEVFRRALLEGHAEEARALLMAQYVAGESAARLLDDMVAPAMAVAGELWRESDRGVFVEHRATAIVRSILHEMRSLIERHDPEPPPLAIGCTPSGDPSVIASLGACVVVEEAGMRAIDLSPSTPIPALEAAIEEHEPRLVWVAYTHEVDHAAWNRALNRLVSGVGRTLGIAFAIGGRAAPTLDLPALPHVVRGDRMSELAAMARGLVAGIHASWS